MTDPFQDLKRPQAFGLTGLTTLIIGFVASPTPLSPSEQVLTYPKVHEPVYHKSAQTGIYCSIEREGKYANHHEHN